MEEILDHGERQGGAFHLEEKIYMKVGEILRIFFSRHFVPFHGERGRVLVYKKYRVVL